MEASLLLAGAIEKTTLSLICLNTKRHRRKRFESEKQCLKILGLTLLNEKLGAESYCR